MKALWLKLAARYDAFSVRERWLIAAGVFGTILLSASTLFIEPDLQRAALAERSIGEQRRQLADLQAQAIALQSPGNNPDVAARAELERAKQQLGELGRRFAELEASLVAPERMPGLLENLIGRNSGLRLLSLRTLPVAPVRGKAATGAADAPALAGLYKHGVEIRLEGGYQDIASYLARLEKAPQKLLWSRAVLSADKHPKLVLTLTVYTLSLDRTWLIV